jgi:SNF2 family DNA or RNA helicase
VLILAFSLLCSRFVIYYAIYDFRSREKVLDECGIEVEQNVLRPAPILLYNKNSVFVPPVAAKWLRPHQREGVQFMYECVMGLRGFNGYGCILADGMLQNFSLK